MIFRLFFQLQHTLGTIQENNFKNACKMIDFPILQFDRTNDISLSTHSFQIVIFFYKINNCGRESGRERKKKSKLGYSIVRWMDTMQ